MNQVDFVFLDRDGVINRKAPEGEYISDATKLELLPGAAAAIAKLNATGRTVIVVTNQRGIALGRYNEDDLAEVHCHLRQQLAMKKAHVDSIYFCPHDRNQCTCRKPEPGLFRQAFTDFPDATSANSVVIGDSLSDIEAGRRLGMRTFFIRGDKRTQKSGAERAEELADAAFESLSEAVAALEGK